MTRTDYRQAWWDIFVSRRARGLILYPVPEDLAPAGSIVRLAKGQDAKVLYWLDADPQENTGVAHKRLAYVQQVGGVIPEGMQEALDNALPIVGLVEEDEVSLLRREELSLYLQQTSGTIQ